jgi:hypothetical protein
MQTLQALVSIQGEPTNSELAYEYREMTEKTAFEYAKLNFSVFQVDSSDIPESNINAYYKEHPDSFTSDEQADLYFVKFPKIATDNDVVNIRK